jgi:IS5 family transposase
MTSKPKDDEKSRMRKRITKRDKFLTIMDNIIPWDEWVAYIEPYYPTGERGRPPMGVEVMLRMYLLQCWFNLSDEGIEDAIYDSLSMQSFMKLNFLTEQIPDATTLLKFRHLLEEFDIGKVFFKAIADTLKKYGHMMHGGTIVDATLISAPSSTKNAKSERALKCTRQKRGMSGISV